MTTTLALRMAIVFEWVFAVSTMILSAALESFLPDPLREYLALEAERVPGLGDLLLLPVLLVVSLGGIASSIGLMFLQRWARWSYLAFSAIACVIIPFLGPQVEHGLAGTFDMIGTTLSGVVLGLAFFTNAIPEKKRTIDT
jgi:hypothetical protein